VGKPKPPGGFTADHPWIQSDKDFNPAKPACGHSIGPLAMTPYQ
jgi:hypothetical protein